MKTALAVSLEYHIEELREALLDMKQAMIRDDYDDEAVMSAQREARLLLAEL